MCYRVAAFRDSHYCMQHDHVLNKLNFDLPLLTPSPRLEGGGGSEGKILICDHVVAFAIPVNLICNMIMF